MGLLVIQDMPAMVDGDRKPDAAQQAEFERQFEIMIDQHKSYPSIYTWVCLAGLNAPNHQILPTLLIKHPY